MPIFDFECKDCHAVYEGVVLRGEKLDKCPTCGSQKSKKLFSTAARIHVSQKGPKTQAELEAAIKVMVEKVVNTISGR